VGGQAVHPSETLSARCCSLILAGLAREALADRAGAVFIGGLVAVKFLPIFFHSFFLATLLEGVFGLARRRAGGNRGRTLYVPFLNPRPEFPIGSLGAYVQRFRF